jgi:O-methyltransferase involved in polyketide biosynthesis
MLEGLAVHLEEQQVADLLTILADLGHDASRVAVSFERGSTGNPSPASSPRRCTGGPV